jgi:hypothetical protein
MGHAGWYIQRRAHTQGRGALPLPQLTLRPTVQQQCMSPKRAWPAHSRGPCDPLPHQSGAKEPRPCCVVCGRAASQAGPCSAMCNVAGATKTKGQAEACRSALVSSSWLTSALQQKPQQQSQVMRLLQQVQPCDAWSTYHQWHLEEAGLQSSRCCPYCKCTHRGLADRTSAGVRHV